MTEPVPRTVSEDEIVDDLTTARYRGIDRLDIDTPKQPRRRVDHLERLAAEYCAAVGVEAGRGRTLQIARLLRDALAGYAEAGKTGAAAFLTDLFFDPPEAARPRLPGERLDAAMRKHATGQAFKELREPLFREFAAFLIHVVADVVRSQARVQDRPLTPAGILPDKAAELAASGAKIEASPSGQPTPLRGRLVSLTSRRRAIAVAGLVLLILTGAVITWGVLSHRGATTDHRTNPAGVPNGQDGGSGSPGRTLTIYNLVTNGADQMQEDPHPVYLSAVARNFCKRDGCALAGTDMHSGAKVQAVCQTQGASTTNGDETSPLDDRNPGLYRSTLWYGVRWPDGRLGFISEVWVAATERGGRGLPRC